MTTATFLHPASAPRHAGRPRARRDSPTRERRLATARRRAAAAGGAALAVLDVALGWDLESLRWTTAS